MSRLLPAMAVTLVLCAFGPQPAGSAPHVPQARPAACRFTPPPGIEAGVRAWLGGCPAGAAEGPGVLRTLPADRPPVLYFGSMSAGRPGPGVVERGGDCYPLAGGDREANVRAFRAAAGGARAAARRLRAQGNLASARYYDAEAERLDRTLD